MRSWWEAVLVVTGLELRQRVRSTRWWASLAGLFATVSVFVFGSLYLAVSAGGARYVEWAEYLYLLVVGVVLFFG
ncbi:MAG TPA: ABC transporter permease, partial [Mycobacterium sp.]|nr:ABC transporter permease [Mycobacterium sp.]